MKLSTWLKSLGGPSVVLPAMPADEALGKQALELTCDDVSWIYRRKESVTLLDSTTARRQISVDFAVPLDVPPLARSRSGAPIQFAPLLMLRKAPRLLTRFDFRDETGSALALPTRRENGAVSGAMLKCMARRVLASPPSAAVDRELEMVALAHPSIGRGIVEDFEDPTADAERRQLVNNSTFLWLLHTLADSSVVTIPVEGGGGLRKIVKLSYDVPMADLDYDEAGYRIGFQGYLAYFDLPFLGGCNYHFELHAPEGIEVMEAGFVDATEPKKLEVTPGPTKRVHFYTHEAQGKRAALAYVQLRVTGRGFLGGASLAACLVAASVTACFAFADELSKAATSTPSILMLFPAAVANYVARPGRHPLTTHLLSYVRGILLLSGGVALMAAARLSVISEVNPASEDALRCQFLVLGIIAWVLAAILLAARSPWLPRRVSKQRGFRRDAQRAGATIEEVGDES